MNQPSGQQRTTWCAHSPNGARRWRASVGMVLLTSFGLISSAGCATVRAGDRNGDQSPAASRFPRDAARFVLQSLSDSTVSFMPMEARWVKPGLTGLAVDPAHGDALVARLEVSSVAGDRAEAIVTGQTTRVADGHVLLLVAPQPRWWRRASFWWGAATGAGLSTAVAALL